MVFLPSRALAVPPLHDGGGGRAQAEAGESPEGRSGAMSAGEASSVTWAVHQKSMTCWNASALDQAAVFSGALVALAYAALALSRCCAAHLIMAWISFPARIA